MRDRRIVEISYVLIRSVIVTAGAILIARWGQPRLGLHLSCATQHLLVIGAGVLGAAWAMWSLVRFEQLVAAEVPNRQ